MLDRRDNGRQRILEGASRILDGGPLADFTVDSLARNLHMSKSTLYKYFESKDHVVVMLVEAACRDTQASLSALDPAAGATASEALERAVGVLAEHSDRVPAAIVLASTDLPPDAAHSVEALRSAIRAHFAAVLSRGKRTGEFTLALEPALAASVYQAALEECVVGTARGLGHLGRGAAVRAFHDVLARGLYTNA
jgi:AcrR family transcriptional regulator